MGGFADYYNQTSVHPLAVLAILVLGAGILLLPRRWAVLPVILMACLIPSAQRIVVGGLDFSLLRVMILFGWVRLILKQEVGGFAWRRMDTLFVAWMGSSTLVFTLQQGTAAGLINRLGFMYQAGGFYFLFRCLIRDWEDVEQVAVSFVLVSVPVMLAFVFEKMTRHNLFSVFGGVPEVTAVRDGKLRCQGAFSHPIMAGVFWGSALPLMGALWWRGGRGKQLAFVGVVSGLVIVWASNSSTSAVSALLVIPAALAFSVRFWMRTVRWCILLMLIGLHLVMNHSVWHLMVRVDITGGSQGYQRYMLLDNAINRFNEWWMLGTKSTAHWPGPVMVDINNQYILEGIRGGAMTMLLFISLLVAAFSYIGRARRLVEPDDYTLAIVWAVGTAFFVHTITFFGVSYFGQTPMVLYLHLAMASGIFSLTTDQNASRHDTASAGSFSTNAFPIVETLN